MSKKERSDFENKFYYTSNQLAKACGISRSTVLRLEKRGLILPKIREKSSSSRMYDVYDVYRASFLVALQHYGFDTEDISSFMESNYDYHVLADKLAVKIQQMQFMYNNITERIDHSAHLQTYESVTPDLIAYAVPVTLTSDWHENMNLYIPAIDQAIRQGLQLNWQYPPSIVIPEDFAKRLADGEKVSAFVNIPVQPEVLVASQRKQIVPMTNQSVFPQEPCLIHFSPAKCSHIRWLGNINGFEKAFDVLRKAQEDAGHAGTGAYHVLLFAGEFFGESIPDSYNYIRINQQIE